MSNERFHVISDALSGEPEVTKRDRDLVTRVVDRLYELDYVLGPRTGAVVIRQAEGPVELPIPRLQLRWTPEFKDARSPEATPWICDYELILPTQPADCRRDIFQPEAAVLAIPFGRTTMNGPTPDAGYKLHTPIRDGAHIKWDAIALNLPAFVICGARWEKIAG